MAEINTRIILRNDTADAWATESGAATPLKAGEAAVEIKDGKAKLKIATADNQSFANAPYIGGAEANVFQVELAQTDLDDEAAINRVVGDTELAVGDIAIVKAAIGGTEKTSYTSYVYDKIGTNEDGTDKFAWTAMDGNYSAANVYTNSKITLAGDYGKDSANHVITSVGNKRIGDSFEAGTSLQSILMDILSQRLQPTTTSPSATILFTNKNANGNADDEVEIGTTYSAQFKTTFSDGKFTYDEVTGCQSTEATVTFDGKTKTIAANSLNGATGTMDSVVIDSTAKRTFSLNYGWTASTIAPKDNLGDPAIENTTIDAASNKTATSSKGVSGYRKAFGGSSAAKTLEANSANIRALKSTAKSTVSSFDVTIDADANFVMIAVPDGRKVTKVEDGNAFGTDIFSEFNQVTGTVQVGGADATTADIGDYATAYNVWTYAPSASLSANTYTVHIANE